MSKKYPSSPPRPKSEEATDDTLINPDVLVRLQKVLASAGHGSRRACEALITEGRVEIDGKTVTLLGTKVDPGTQDIRVDGESLAKPKLRYFLVNKPLGVLSTNSDPAGRTRVVDLVRSDARLFTVGRLDKSSEGLIIVTNDGELANLLSHPRYGVEKTYLALVAGEPDKKVFEQLQNGVHLAEGWAHAKTVRIKARQQHSTLLEIVLDEGRNREVRRLLARVGHKVLRLQRIAQGSLRLGNLAPGEYRPLTLDEIELLKEGARESINKPRPKRPRKTRENTLRFENPTEDREPALYDSSANSKSTPRSYEADDDDVSSGAEVDQFFKSNPGSVISDEEADGGEEAPAKPAKKPRRVVPASTSLKPIIDLRVKKLKAEKPPALNVVSEEAEDDDDADTDDEGDFSKGFPGAGSAAEKTGGDEPKPRRKMMPGLDKRKEATGKKFVRRQGMPQARGERTGDGERPRRSFGDGPREGGARPAGRFGKSAGGGYGARREGGSAPRGDRAGGGYQGKRPYNATAGGSTSGRSGGARGKSSFGDRPFKPRKDGDSAPAAEGGEKRTFGGRSGTRTPGGGGYQGKRPYGAGSSDSAPRSDSRGGGFRGKSSGARPFKSREGADGGSAPEGERKRFAAFNKAKRPYSPRTGEGSGAPRGGKPGFGARPGGKPRLNKERTGDSKPPGRKFGGKESGPRKSTGYTGSRRGEGRGFTPKTDAGGKPKRKKD